MVWEPISDALYQREGSRRRLWRAQ